MSPRSFVFFFLPNPQTLTLIRHLSSSPISAGAGDSKISIYLHRARLIDSLRLRLRSHDPSKPFPLPSPSPPYLDSFVAVQLLRFSPSADVALSFFNSLPFSHPSILHTLAKRLAHSKRIPHLHSTLTSLNGRLSPLDRLRYLSIAGDLDAALQTWSSIRSAASAAKRHPCTEAYNLVINLYASDRSDSAAVDTFLSMIADGANPNSRTYTVIIEHLIGSGSLYPALEIFDLLPSMRVRRTTRMYNVIAGELSSSNRFEKLESLVKEMKSDGILPGRSMRESIAKLRAAGFEEITEEFASELSPNEKIEYVVDDSEADSDDEEEEAVAGESTGADRIRLKPWMDPAAVARALNGWDPVEVKALESAGFVWTPRLVCKLLRSFKKPEPAWEFFCWVAYQPGGFAHDRQTVTRMISILTRTGHVELVDRLLSKLEAEQIQLPFTTVKLAIDFYGLSKQPDAAIRIYRNVGSICGSLSQSDWVILSSSLLRTLVKCKKKFEAMEMLEEMIGEGILLDLQTFSGLMQYFAGEGDMKSVHRLFGLVRQCGLEPDGYMHRVLICAYCRNERSALGLRVFVDMMSLGLLPDRGTKELLVKSLYNEGKLREAAMVEERCEGLEERMPVALPGHIWTVSEANFSRVCDIYAGCFRRGDGPRV